METSILDFNMLGVFLIVSFCLLILFIVMFCIFLFVTRSGPDLWSHENEKYFVDPKNSSSKIEFPSLKEDASCFLSVVVPAYNEEERLEIMMDEALTHLEYRQKQSKNFTYEVIVVDDGSKDKTSEIALKYSQKFGASKVRVLTQVKNRGKGGAVRMGVLRTRGKLILFCDADGATKFSDLDRLEAELMKLVNGKVGKEDMAIVCGSRAHLEKDSIAKRSLLRTILMYGFHFLVWFLCVRGVKDTQCGFKLFTRSAARILFYNLHVHRWAFDVDLLHIAQHYKIPVAEVAVNWTEIPGSKLSPLWASIQMARDLFLIRLRYMTGSWTMVEKRWQNEKKSN